jgi:hypothetical protein
VADEPGKPIEQGGRADAGEPDADSSEVSEPSEGAVADGEGALPRGYGEDRVVAMLRGPDSLFAYWDLTGAESARLRRQFGDACEWVLRVSDTTTGRRGDTLVDPHAGSYYVKLVPGGRYAVQLGMMVAGTFHPVCESAECQLPPAEPRAGTAATWADSRTGQMRPVAPGRRPFSRFMAGLAYDPASGNASSSSSHTLQAGRQAPR